MSLITRLTFSVLAVCGAVLFAEHAGRAIDATVPADMPADSSFLPSGYNIATNEAQGNWVVCRVDAAQATDWCRVTDQKGSVVFQGDYLPADSPAALSAGQLQVAKSSANKMWVRGPAEQGPIPVISLTNGKVLVPAADRDALEQRWSADPSELSRVSGQ